MGVLLSTETLTVISCKYFYLGNQRSAVAKWKCVHSFKTPHTGVKVAFLKTNECPEEFMSTFVISTLPHSYFLLAL